MPPKPKFTREEIITTALDLVSQKGVGGLTARDLGNALGSSARPIFTVFKNMEEVGMEVRKAAMARFETFPEHCMPDMPFFKQVGMGMILFGSQEPKLYQLLFMQENQQASTFADVLGVLGPMADRCLSSLREYYSLSDAQARLLFENVWIYTFGVGALCATRVCHFSQEELGTMLTTQFQAMYHYVIQEEHQG